MPGESRELFASSTSKLLSSGQLPYTAVTFGVFAVEQMQAGLLNIFFAKQLYMCVYILCCILKKVKG